MGEFDEDLIRCLIGRIKVTCESKVEIHFKSGIIMEQGVAYYVLIHLPYEKAARYRGRIDAV